MDKDDVDTFISTIYYDPEKGLMGVDKLYKKLKTINKKVTLKQVKNWLKNQATYQIHYSKHKKIKFLPIDSDQAQDLIKTFKKKQQDIDTVYLYRNGKSYTMSSAAIRCLLYLKWYWKIWFPFFWIVPLPLRNIVYKIVAKYRHYIFSKPKVCSF